MSRYVYDTGALLAAESNDRRLWSLHNEALAARRPPVVPAPVLAQAWRGGPQPLLSRLLKNCVVESMDEPTAREAGRTCALAGSHDVVDATVIVVAVRSAREVVTSDRKDMEGLSRAVGRPVEFHAV
jgi:hypothetical protein